ncbi:arginine--tRNA ligase [bacterium]|nr:MAG: arginine--tRNA ligase [bacterium]QQR61670.1 MAG: arginine--tRNA ligase [bacterium]
MSSIAALRNAFGDFIKSKYACSAEHLKQCNLILNTDYSKKQFGDLSSNAPLILAKLLGRNPLDIGQEIKNEFAHEYIEKKEIAGAGFFNIFLAKKSFIELAQDLFEHPTNLFKHTLQQKLKISIEYVSANPTGPLHFGHGRGGIIGDVLANVLTFLGHNVTKEFYVNDAGTQIEKLAMSLIIRCQQELGIEATLPEDAYHGEYLIDLAKKCIQEYGSNVLEKPEFFFKEYAQEQLLKQIKQTLQKYGIQFNVFFSEKTLHESKAIDQSIELLTRKGFVYEKEGALWFASSQFGDDKDRVIRKTNGEWTYVAADIAYLKNKIDRGFNSLFMVLGHDHHSYATRLQAIRAAFDINVPLEVILYQLVKIKEGDIEVRMSKRKGAIIELDDIIDTVGKDVARFFYLHRKADAHLDFDLNLALKKTDENPVYYIQYAYVRIKSILNKASDVIESLSLYESDAKNISETEYMLLKKVIALQDLLETVIENHQTHLLTYYVLELAQLFHLYYNEVKVIDPAQLATTKARLLVLVVVKNTLGLCLDLLGLSKPERM